MVLALCVRKIMKMINVHNRVVNKQIAEVGALLDSLSSNNDNLWPYEKWSPMKFDRDLSEGAIGGHGPIKYVVTSYLPGKKINFEFIEPPGFHGNHWFELKEKEESKTEIIHTINMNVSGVAVISWLIIIRYLHDALIEDSFDKAQKYFGIEAKTNNWSPWVRFLRFLLKRKKTT